MAKEKKVYICESCGNEFPKWQGQCPACKEWNTIKEFKTSIKSKSGISKLARPIKISKVNLSKSDRVKTNIEEFDRVLGGGLVVGSFILLSGQPGIGKSTLLIQVASSVKGNVLYFTGEESEQQIKSRYNRLDLKSGNINILADQKLGSLEKAIEKDIKLIIIDSIQTIYDESIDQSSGGVSQIKSCGYKIGEIAKRNAIPIIVTGHITKQGRIAGPKTLEHLVDGVFYLEGDSNYDQRILKSIKNRYGSTGEVGIFKMSQKGLEQVANPSSLFLSQASFGDIFGGVTASIMEGQRPLLIEVQALAERTVFGYPKRRAQGISSNRLELLSAVISNKTNLNLSDKDIYVNIVGGMSVDEPSIDLPICLAIVSALRKKPINKKIVCFGEVGLSGEIRPVSDIPSRLKEAKRLGYKKAIIAKSKDKNYRSKSLDITPAGTLKEAIELAF
jgi:DNA repair protein RadA/Sms